MRQKSRNRRHSVFICNPCRDSIVVRKYCVGKVAVRGDDELKCCRIGRVGRDCLVDPRDRENIGGGKGDDAEVALYPRIHCARIAIGCAIFANFDDGVRHARPVRSQNDFMQIGVGESLANLHILVKI